MVIAITGTFGSGKSTVLSIFKSLGAVTVSADTIVHKVLEREDIKEKIADVFGPEILRNGELDKKALAERAFSSSEMRRKLEEILHPIVFEEIERVVRENSDKTVVAEVPLLFEVKAEESFDVVITVVASEDVVMKRLLNRGFSEDEIKRRLAHQLPAEYKVERADYVIDNSEDLYKTRLKVEKIWNDLLRR